MLTSTDFRRLHAQVKLDYVTAFTDHLVLYGRQHGFNQLWVYEPKTGARHAIEHPDAVYTAYGSHNAVYTSGTARDL